MPDDKPPEQNGEQKDEVKDPGDLGGEKGEVVIRAEHVEKSFGDQVVLKDVNVEVRRGETLVILGGSGSGKSTLLKLMSAGLRATGGRVMIGGEDLCQMSDQRRDEYRKTIGVLFQSGALFNSMTVAENVALPMRELTDLDEETIGLVVKIKLELVGLRDAADRLPAELSGGMKKRAGLARALSLDPQMLFYDEPSAGLDPPTVAGLDMLLNKLRDDLGVTGVVVTHEMESAFRVADRMVLLDGGKFVATGTPQEMKDSDDPLVKQFIHGLTEGPLTERRKNDDYVDDLLKT